MTREAREQVTVGWQENYNNKSLSGIEVCDHHGKLMNFINIRHDEILKNKPPHRIQISLNEDAEPILPPPQTFDEIIQAKRRHQMLLYGSGSSTSSSSSAAPTANTTIAAPTATRAPPTASTRAPPSASAPTTSTPTAPTLQPPTTTTKAPPPAPTSGASATSVSAAAAAAAAAAALAPKDIKAMLKSTPPGHSIVLPDGTVIKKSRRGGARAGAGRKRSRPLPGGAPQSTSSTSVFNTSNK